MTKAPVRRCAVYTRKSSEEGLDQDFNSLHAQREACEAFIKSQVGEGWKLISTAYDDGGLSGGNMDRPGLQKLLEDIKSKRIDVVVVYKVDRLTRSLADFAKIVEVFDASGVSFVAVTQQFNTTSSMGRLTLNILLSFAQFEREVTGERIRDKIAASKAKGMWMGGYVPLGYRLADRKLHVIPEEAERIKLIFERYLQEGNVRKLRKALDRDGIRSKSRGHIEGRMSGGTSFSRGALYQILRSPLYIGQIRHKDSVHTGQHDAIVSKELWDRVQASLDSTNAEPGPRQKSANILIGKLIDPEGRPLITNHAAKGGRRYRYYVSEPDETIEKPTWRLPALELERAVVDSLTSILSAEAALAIDVSAPDRSTHGALKQSKDVLKRLRAGDEKDVISEIVRMIEINADGLRIDLGFLSDTDPDEVFSITRFVPMQIKRRGVEMRIVLESGSRKTEPDMALLKAIARGRVWFNEILEGKVRSQTEIARREGLADQYVNQLVRLALLSPKTVEAIVNGRQPVTLTANDLVHRVELPLEWASQERLFNIR
jgi:DNA invertase Pin-like site-specific DNA recombinase